jgi:hypothetical protein
MENTANFVTKEQFLHSTESVAAVFDAPNTTVNTTYCQPANLIPHFWYYKIVDKDNSPDLPCIMILSELFGWFRKLPQTKHYHDSQKHLPELTDGGQLAISYEYLSEKLNFQKERIRRKLVRLEELGILSREIRNITLEDGSRINQLYISIDQKFFNSCFRNPELDIRVWEDQFSTNNSSVDSSVDSSVSESSSPLYGGDGSPPYGGDHISKKNKKNKNKNNKNRSTRSNFYFNFFENENIEKDSNAKPKTFAESISKIKQARKLEDFYPLTDSDCKELQSKSGRSFTLNAMNEILKDMSKKLTQPEFWSKKGFISYMTQAFRYEKRNPELISGENFRIRNAMNKEELEYREKEKYLEEIEYSLQTGAQWHLRKKLASVFSTDKAYEILQSYKNLKIGDGGNGGICELELNKRVQLSDNDKNLILSQIQATHEGIAEYGTRGFEKITSLRIKTPEDKPKEQSFSVSDVGSQNQMQNQLNHQTEQQIKQQVKNPTKNQANNQTRWKKIRNIFASYYHGADGHHLDKNWLSKLDAHIDEEQKTVNLKAPSEFYQDYIQNNLFSGLNSAIKAEGFTLNSIEYKN